MEESFGTDEVTGGCDGTLRLGSLGGALGAVVGLTGGEEELLMSLLAGVWVSDLDGFGGGGKLT